MKSRAAAVMNHQYAKYAIYIAKGALIGLGISALVVLLLALLIKMTGMSEGAIPVINQIIKITCIFISTWIALKAIREKGWMVGGITGLVYVLFGFLLFSLVDGSFSMGSMPGDLLSGLIAGVISGVIGMNFLK